jgi:hypothetical protein
MAMASVLSEPARATGGNAHARKTATVKSIFGFIVIFHSAQFLLHKYFMLTYSLGRVPSQRNRAAKRGYVHRYLHRAIFRFVSVACTG